MIRHAVATTLLGRGSAYLRPSPQSLPASGHLGRRLLASSSKAPPPTRPTPPASSRPKDQGQAAIDKAEMLHAELNEMIAARKAEKVEQLQQPIGTGFVSFLKASKPEIFNIFFAFVCVLLAWQIHGLRNGIKRLMVQNEEKEAEIDRLRGILANLSCDDGEGEENANDNSLSARVAQKCAEVVRRTFEDSEKRVGYSWILGKKLAGGDALELEKLTDEMRPVILADIQRAVGDAAFTAEELKERRVAALQEEHEVVGGESLPSVAGKEAQMGELMQILDQVHTQDLTDEQKAESGDQGEGKTTTVRRTRYAI
ncbi:hypothetical protein ACHAXT_003129 [Thalassiosira profunda]